MNKMDDKKEKKSFEAFMKNPAWKKRYEEAPTKECKDYYRFTFYFSKYYDPEEDNGEFEEMRDYYYNQLSADDWKYIKGNTSGPFVGYINQRIAELEK